MILRCWPRVTSRITIRGLLLPIRTIRASSTAAADYPRTRHEPKLFMAVAEDVTEQKAAKERIAYLAHHDVLTGWPTAGAFEEHFSATLPRCRACHSAGRPSCAGPRSVQGSQRHVRPFGGDALLREVAARLCDVASDAFIARLGGDEFTVVVGVKMRSRTDALACRESHCGRRTALNIEGRSIRVGLTIGIARSPDDGTDSQI